jgi:2-oxoglutarate dehydrogenase E2 component (dihydrolipoamide succinyltransferase)
MCSNNVCNNLAKHIKYKLAAMAQVELIMPKMGESIMEATILKWLKNEGDFIDAEESVLEIATDKVDSEVPSPVSGTLSKILFNENDVVEVGKAIALIQTDSPDDTQTSSDVPVVTTAETTNIATLTAAITTNTTATNANNSTRFYSPLVLNMARQENISMAVLETILGTGKNDRVTKKDMLAFIEQKNAEPKTIAPTPVTPKPVAVNTPTPVATAIKAPKVDTSGNVDIVEMSRMRKLIADHMIMSKHVSPHVTSFVEVDVTNLVNWRNKIKGDFQKQEGEKITFTPIFIQAVAKALKAFPWVNASVDGYNVVVRKDINVGMATATPSGELIVPVIHNADQLNLVGLTKKVNNLANRARTNKLKPDEIQGGTFTITNVGSFGSLMGTPIISQPQVAILAVGAIRKKPAVLETEYGDVIAIRQLMIMSMSYDHRIVDGALGSKFMKNVAELLENFDGDKAW